MSDPLLAPWTGAHGGVPPFDQITQDAWKTALEQGMAAARAELAAIGANPAPATFANAIAALEDTQRGLNRAGAMFGVYVSTMADKAMQQLEQDFAPVMAAFADDITQDEKLFARIQAVHDRPGALDAEQRRLVEVMYRGFARRGAALDPAGKARMKAINARLATLYTTFGQNELHDEETQQLALSDGDLDGLPASFVAAAKTGDGTYAITNTRSSMEPFLTFSARRDLRERGWRMWVQRGDHAGAHDNKPIIAEILALRAERAKLLGFASHAHWMTDDTMARTPDAAMALMMKVWPAAVARAREEIADMHQLAAEKIEPWDYRYYAEKVRKAKYDLDQNEVKPYLQLEHMREAMFWASGQLYGFAWQQITDVPTCHPDVRVWEVTKGGKRIGLWYFDPYAREGKRSGAWMSEYRTQEQFNGEVTPIVSNNSNFVKGEAGTPVLITWDDARTLFHEFGHALHGLNSAVCYPSLAGTNTLRDFVEFPSQLNEHWLSTPEVLERYAVHVETGAPIPKALVEKIQKSKHFNQGFGTVEYLAAAIYDMKIHMLDHAVDPAAFEAQTMREIGCPPEIVMRHRPTQFGHIFSGDGYSAGYYSYIWADTLTADAAEAFVEAGSFYDQATAKKLRDAIMSVGNTVPPDVAFRAFRGRDVDTNALMRDRGFPTG